MVGSHLPDRVRKRRNVRSRFDVCRLVNTAWLVETGLQAVENPIRQLFGAPERELKSLIHAVACGANPMMSPGDCRKRSAECLAAAQLCSEDHSQQAWKQLSDLWAAWSDTLGALSKRGQLASIRGLRSPLSL